MSDNRVNALSTLFGGKNVLARELGVNKSLVTRWSSSTLAHAGHGRVPPSYNHRVIEAADRLGVAREAVSGLLEPCVCEACGRAFEPGA